jgi:septal ring factor EnvC (AmiA/AmiB activator)
MDIAFSFDWIFIVMSLGCVFFLLQMLLDYNRNREQIQPQMHQIEEIRSRHDEERLKVQRLIEEANSEGAVVDGELEKLDKKHKELEAALIAFDEKEKD